MSSEHEPTPEFTPFLVNPMAELQAVMDQPAAHDPIDTSQPPTFPQNRADRYTGVKLVAVTPKDFRLLTPFEIDEKAPKEATIHSEDTKLMCAAITEKTAADKQTAGGFEVALYGKEVIQHLGGEPTPELVQLTHRARRLAFTLAEVNHDHHAREVSIRFSYADQPEKNWYEIVRRARRQVDADPVMTKKLTLCLPLMVENPTDTTHMDLVKSMACLALLQISYSNTTKKKPA